MRGRKPRTRCNFCFSAKDLPHPPLRGPPFPQGRRHQLKAGTIHSLSLRDRRAVAAICFFVHLRPTGRGGTDRHSQCAHWLRDDEGRGHCGGDGGCPLRRGRGVAPYQALRASFPYWGKLIIRCGGRFGSAAKCLEFPHFRGCLTQKHTSFFFFLLKTKKAGVFIAENSGLVCSSEMWFVIKILQITEVDSYQIINVSTLVE